MSEGRADKAYIAYRLKAETTKPSSLAEDEANQSLAHWLKAKPTKPSSLAEQKPTIVTYWLKATAIKTHILQKQEACGM